MTTVEEFDNFSHKMEWEGGMWELIEYGGYEIFPVEVQELARRWEEQGHELRKALRQLGKDLGSEELYF